jgi:hypothetical protein
MSCTISSYDGLFQERDKTETPSSLRFGVFMAMKIDIVVSCVKTPCVPVGKYNILEKHNVPIRESNMFLETLAHTYQAIWCYNPEYNNNNSLSILNNPTIL